MHTGIGMSEGSPEPPQSDPEQGVRSEPTLPTNELSMKPSSTRAWLHRKIDEYTERFVRILFFWETNDKKLGILIRFLHHSLIYMALIWYVVIHTFLPSYFLFVGFYCFCLVVWLHHIISWGCVLNRLEQKLVGDTATFVGPILEIFHIPVTADSTDGVVVMGATVCIFFLTFELLSRSIVNVRSWLYL
jgi:hypothetical protein